MSHILGIKCLRYTREHIGEGYGKPSRIHLSPNSSDSAALIGWLIFVLEGNGKQNSHIKILREKLQNNPRSCLFWR